MPKVPRSEQETIITYDYSRNQWHLSTDVAKHIRKWIDLVINPKVTVEGGEVIYLEGWLNATVSVQKKRKLTEEQRLALSQRMRRLQAGQSNES